MTSKSKKPTSKIAPQESAPVTLAWRVPTTRTDSRQLSGYFPTAHVLAFRSLAASNDMDVQELLAEAINMLFERYSLPNRVPVTSGRRTRRAG